MQASLLLSEGHQQANQYPLSRLWIEAEIVRERVNQRIATESTMMQAVIVAVLSPAKGEGAKHLQKLLKGLTDGN